MDYQILKKDGFRKRKAAWVKTPDNTTDAYYIDYRGSADLIVHRGGAQGPIVGRVQYHKWKGYTEIWFENNERVEMKRDKVMSSTHVVQLSAAPETSPFQWKDAGGKLSGGNLRLEDNKGQCLALYNRKSDSGKFGSKDGVLTITMSGITQPLMDQMVVTLMAVAEKLRQRRGAAGAAAVAAA